MEPIQKADRQLAPSQSSHPLPPSFIRLLVCPVDQDNLESHRLPSLEWSYRTLLHECGLSCEDPPVIGYESCEFWVWPFLLYPCLSISNKFLSSLQI